MKKESLLPNKAIVLGDFTENYQFIVQDEFQSFHWSKEYCTLHPVLVYFLDDDDKTSSTYAFILMIIVCSVHPPPLFLLPPIKF